MRAALLGGCLLAGALAPALAADYSFDLSEIEAQPYEFSGFAEGKLEHFALRPDAALYPPAYGASGRRSDLMRGTAPGELSGKAKQGALTAYGRLSVSASSDALGTDTTGTVMEAGARVSPSEGLTFDLGKQVQRWGKGYAWNPVAFFERPKDPNDPSASREGFVMVRADGVRSLKGPTMTAIGFEPVLLPVSSSLNTDYGSSSDANPGARLYLLVADTDVDLLWAAKGSKPERVGLDFSRNLGSQWEVHGEWAWAFNATRRWLGASGQVNTAQTDVNSWLLGARYITASEVTWIGELYRNGAGYSEAQLSDYYRLLQGAYAPGASSALRNLASSLAQAGYGRANPGRDYAYLRVSAKDAFGWLYLNPALTTIVNLQDRSWQLTPELSYTGWNNMELRGRIIWLQGQALTEFGEKATRQRIELSLKLYF